MQFNLERDPRTHTILSYAPGQVVVTIPWAALAHPAPTALAHPCAALEGDITPLLMDRDGELRGRIRHETLTRSVIIMPEQLVKDWPPQGRDDLTAAHFDALVAMQPEVVLFGSGPRLWWPPSALISAFARHRIGFEVMDTAAACRTYNILVYEGRNVAAALLMI